MNPDDTRNQNLGAVSPGAEHYLVETNLGNSYIISQWPQAEVSFHVITADTGHEVEVARHKLDLSDDEISKLRSMQKSHDLELDKTTGKVVATPKHPRRDTPQA